MAKQIRPWLRGEKHGRAKLTEADVRAIRSRYRWHDKKDGVTAIARDYGMAREAIRLIVLRVNWAYLDAAP